MNNLELVKKVKASGSHFFDEKTMIAFNSKIVTSETTVLGYFITSEDTNDGKGTGYTIRQVLDSGEVDRKSGFNEFKSLTEAKKGLELLMSKVSKQ